jgi:hypothetical protein
LARHKPFAAGLTAKRIERFASQDPKPTKRNTRPGLDPGPRAIAALHSSRPRIKSGARLDRLLFVKPDVAEIAG